MVYRFTSEPMSPFKRGKQFGAVHRIQIARTIHSYVSTFEKLGSSSRLDLDEIGFQFLERIQRWSPSLADELHGIAEGSRISVLQLAAINSRTEILAQIGVMSKGECSTVVTLRGGGRSPLAMQTWDWYTCMSSNWLEWTIVQEGGGAITTVTEYGILGKIGINHHGVAVLMNILHHHSDTGSSGIPVHIIARQVLDNATNVADSLKIISSAEVSASTCMTVVAPSAEAAMVELWPHGPSVIRAADSDSFLLHTNHFLTTPGRQRDLEPGAAPDTLTRFRQLADLERIHRGKSASLCEADILTALADHHAGASAVCCHASGPEIGLQFATLATIVVDFANTSLRTYADGPCTLQWRED